VNLSVVPPLSTDSSHQGASHVSWPAITFRIGLFLLLYGGLHWSYPYFREGALYGTFIDTCIVQPAAIVINGFWSADAVRSVGPELIWPGGRFALPPACDGFDALSLFVSALLVAGISWRRGIAAVLAGCTAIWVLNQVRAIGLYWAFRYEHEWFDSLQTVWAPALLIAVAAALFAWIVPLNAFVPAANSPAPLSRQPGQGSTGQGG
jgi:exosortase/archaeosortase family protein